MAKPYMSGANEKLTRRAADNHKPAAPLCPWKHAKAPSYSRSGGATCGVLASTYFKCGRSSGGTKTLMDLGCLGTLLINLLLSSFRIIW